MLPDWSKNFLETTKQNRLSRRDNPIVAWREVPGEAPPRKSRPVGYGVMVFLV